MTFLSEQSNDTWYNAAQKLAGFKSIPYGKTGMFTEIEVRFEGEDPYSYFLRRTESDSGISNYIIHRWVIPIMVMNTNGKDVFYRKKRSYMLMKLPKYIYYAKIREALDENGILVNQPLKTNTLYYIKLWARIWMIRFILTCHGQNRFSQADDKEKNKDSHRPV